ncbi:MAG TPA: BREX protein BrxB domain-containing protein [Armatimonadota bacterium]|nr:BREX protein BrxB domain-containing protein [Armatimonadota bacterium]
MGGVERLLVSYERHISIPWDPRLAGAQRVWFALYDPPDERRLRCRIEEFGRVTMEAGHGWRHKDLTDLFPQWMAEHEYRESYFEEPELIDGSAMAGFAEYVIRTVSGALSAPEADENSVVAFSGLGSLYGLIRFSAVLEQVNTRIVGRMLAFFPGEFDNSNYRLYGARDGWNYHAVPITAQESVG